MRDVRPVRHEWPRVTVWTAVNDTIVALDFKVLFHRVDIKGEEAAKRVDSG